MVQGDLFKDDVQLAIDLLESKGYAVIPPKKKVSIDCRKLVNFFYQRLGRYHPQGSYMSSNTARDMKLAKYFAQSLFERGCPSEKVWDYAHDVIECMLKHEDKLGLKNPITDMTILGQDKLRWITDKTILIMEGEIAEGREADREKLEDRLEALQDELVEESIENDPDDLERILEGIKRRLEDGEKETSS
jgi:hypothetical protein